MVANAIMGVFLAPDMVLPRGGPGIVGSAVQMAIGLLLLSRRSFSVAGVLTLLVALPLAAVYVPSMRLLDYLFEFAALGLVFVFTGNSPGYVGRVVGRWLRNDPARLAHLPLPIVRIGIGVTFIVLALHNKLLSPNLALTFLDQHDLNFVSLLGFSQFTDLHFVFAAGMAEVALGLLLVLGVTTRLVAAALVAVFSTTLAVLGPMELVGHLPLLGIAILLVYRGAGGYRVGAPGARGASLQAPRAA